MPITAYDEQQMRELMRRRVPFRWHIEGGLSGSSFNGYGTIREALLRDLSASPSMCYWIYAGTEPIAWVTYSGEVHLPAIWHDDEVAKQQALVAQAFGIADPWEDRRANPLIPQAPRVLDLDEPMMKVMYLVPALQAEIGRLRSAGARPATVVLPNSFDELVKDGMTLLGLPVVTAAVEKAGVIVEVS